VNVVCVAVSVTLPTADVTGAAGVLATHVDACERCRSEADSYRRLHETLASMRDETVQAPGSLKPRVMSSLGPVAVPDLETSSDHRVQVAAAAAIATAAAGTAMLMRLYRHRAA